MEAKNLSLQHDSDSDALAAGDRLLGGQYTIMRFLNSGGFGITYLAKDSLNRTVVIKECFPEAFCHRVNKSVRAHSSSHARDFRSIVDLFIKEAHALARLQHPSVVGVHQVFEDNETAYMALDLIDGQDLLAGIEDDTSRLAPADLHAITLKLLDAIGHVHSQDLLHRDISPDNILVDKTGHPVLIDFGAAREEASRKSRVLSSVLVVKDGYSPPEFYAVGSPQLPCSDLYALAATLVHVITGETPPNSQERLAALAGRQPDPYVPLAGRLPQYDSAYLEAIDQAMHVVPSARIQTAEDWALRIDQSKRVEMARARAQSDQEINAKVTNLLEWATRDAAAAPDDTQDRAARKPQAEAALHRAKPPLLDLRDLRPETPDVAKAPEDQEQDQEQGHDPQPETVPPCPDSALDTEEADAPGTDAPAPQPLTPYERVRSTALKRAADAAQMRHAAEPDHKTTPGLSRFAAVPVVFCAYLFYAHAAFQHETVQATTIAPIVTLGSSIVDGFATAEPEPEAEPELVRPTVVVRRGLQD